jgi:hypothetical protein
MTVLREIFPVLAMQQGMFLQLQWHPAARDDAKMKQVMAFTVVAAMAAAAAPVATASAVAFAICSDGSGSRSVCGSSTSASQPTAAMTAAAAAAVVAAKAQASLRLGCRHAVAGTLAFPVVAAMYHQAMMMRAAAAVTFPVVAAMYHQAMMMRAAAAVTFPMVAGVAGAAAVVQAAPAVTATVMMKAQAMLRLGRRHTVPPHVTSPGVAGLRGLLLGHLLELWIRTIFALSVAKNPALWHFFIKGSVEGTTSSCVCVKAVLDTAPEENH